MVYLPGIHQVFVYDVDISLIQFVASPTFHVSDPAGMWVMPGKEAVVAELSKSVAAALGAGPLLLGTWSAHWPECARLRSHAVRQVVPYQQRTAAWHENLRTHPIK